MTDKMTIDKKMMNGGELPLLDGEDEKLLLSFFADCRMDIPDDGFSDRVMAALPSANRRLEHLWTAACVIMGLVFLFVFQGMDSLKDSLFAFKISFLTNGSRILSQTADAFAQSTNLWMMLGGVVVLMLVWGYNELMDAQRN